MALRWFEYGDPAKVAERKEGQTCKGCVHLGRLLGRDYCERMNVKQGAELRRCTKYKEAG